MLNAYVQVCTSDTARGPGTSLLYSSKENPKVGLPDFLWLRIGRGLIYFAPQRNWANWPFQLFCLVLELWKSFAQKFLWLESHWPICVFLFSGGAALGEMGEILMMMTGLAVTLEMGAGEVAGLGKGGTLGRTRAMARGVSQSTHGSGSLSAP